MKRSKIFHAFYDRLRCMSPTYSLAICWLTGLLSGVAYGYRTDQSSLLLMRIAAFSRMSIVGLLFVLYIPLIFSLFAIYKKRPHWMIAVSFLKAFLFASCGAMLHVAFGSAGWLVRLMLQFSDICALPFFYWFCIRNITGQNDRTRLDFVICCVANAILGIFDFCVISPFLVKLIDI